MDLYDPKGALNIWSFSTRRGEEDATWTVPPPIEIASIAKGERREQFASKVGILGSERHEVCDWHIVGCSLQDF